MKEDLEELIRLAKELGLKELNATQDLNAGEFGLCFDLVVTQLYEYNIPITTEFYTLVCMIAADMKIPGNEYTYLKELII